MSRPGRWQRSAHLRFEAVSAFPPGRPSSTGHMQWQIANLYVPGADNPLVQVIVKALIQCLLHQCASDVTGNQRSSSRSSPFLFRHDLRCAPSSKPPGLPLSTESLPACLD